MYSYEYSTSVAEEAAGFAMGILAAVLIIYLLMIVFAIVCYVLQSLGVYKIAKRRQIGNPWLAWLPIGSEWIWGSISDQYQYVAKGKVKSRRKILLVMAIIGMLAGFLSGSQISNVFTALITIGERGEYMSEAQIMNMIMTPYLNMMGLSLIASVLSFVQMIFMYISLFDLYESCNPDKAPLFLVLSILFGILQPFFIFSCRNKDLGMPPRKEETVPEIPAAQEIQDPWVNE